MRSRFSAFSIGGHGNYLLDTWLPSFTSNLSESELSKRSLNWRNLEIVKKSQKGDKGVVEFRAYYLNHAGEEHVHHEISRFIRESGQWLYVDGDVLT
jgi:SEC-C motif-containing protein